MPVWLSSARRHMLHAQDGVEGPLATFELPVHAAAGAAGRH